MSQGWHGFALYLSCARNDCSRSIVWDHLVPGRAVQVAWDLPQASPRCPCWLRWAHPRLCLLQVLSVLGFPSGVARAVSFVCRRRMPSEPDVFYRCRARLMALVPKAGMDSPLLCFARNDRFPGLPSRNTQLPGWAVQCPLGTCLRSHFAVQVCS